MAEAAEQKAAAEEPEGDAPAAPGRGPGLPGKLGPGLISGAANDDPSCIVSFAMAGAAFGYLTLWTSLFMLPLIAAVQLMSARLGMVSGRGLAGAVRANYSRWVLYPTCLMLVVANVVTIGADLGGMAAVSEMVTGIPALAWTPAYAVLIVTLLFYLSYRRIEKIFRWLCLVLFAYVAAGLLAKPDWNAVLAGTLLPHVEWSGHYLSVIIAILGATISPYFVFWQATQQVEEEYARGRRTVAQRQGATRTELARSRVDVLAGAFVSKLITYSITLTTAATLHASGRTGIASAEEAAAALEPLAGRAASWLFSLGVIGTGMLAVPVLACSASHAVSEAMAWRASLQEKPSLLPKFYGVLLVAVLLGLGLIYAGFSLIDMLFWASVLNGLLAAPCILLVLLLTRNPDVMGRRANPAWLNGLGWLSVVVVGAASPAMLASFLL